MKNLKNILKIWIKNPMILCILLSIGLNLIVEILSRRSVYQAFVYLFTSPVIFIYNTTLILTTLSIALFFKKRTFALSMISIAWIAVGVTDFVLLLFRTTPFTAVDITLIKSAIAIWQYYLKFYHLILIAAAFILLIIGCIILFKKTKRVEKRPALWKIILFCMTCLLCSIGLNHIGLKANFLARNFGNLANAYHSYGLPYCFISSIINTGIEKPSNYSNEVVSTIVDGVETGKLLSSEEITPDVSITEEPVETQTPTPTITASPTPVIPTTTADEKTPNIIFIQLESFFDPTSIIGTAFSEDPIPFWRSLKESCTTGYLDVPSVGAGTANTEFETITGMNLDFFGPGEYPYKTILKKTTCESINYNLKPCGYTTHAIHNNSGTFYDRHLVFSQLGFDSFTSVEYMNNLSFTPKGWAKDNVLTSEIIKALNQTPNQDFIYTITVEGHGSYPDSALIENPQITLETSEEAPEGIYYPLLYYVNIQREVDDFIKDLITTLEARDEKTIVVMYGDHLPGFNMTEENLSNHSMYQTEYVMWSNFPMERETKELQSYQLSAYVLSRLDIHNGLLTKLHQTQQYSDAYLDELKILEYDMLYGDLECFNGVNPYAPTDLKMGTNDITVDKADFISSSTSKAPGLLVVNGRNFTTYSKIYVNDKLCNTIFVNNTVIIATIESANSGDKINVIQSGEDMYELSRTKDYIIP